MIHQNVFLFEDTLRANITMFQEYPDEEIKAAVKKAGLEKIVEDNPLGTEQMVCENGNNFFRWGKTADRDCKGNFNQGRSVIAG